MDYGPSTLEVLPEIVDAVAGKVPVIFDSGVRRGTDIVKALALGANAVVGRLLALGRPKHQGVQRVLEIKMPNSSASVLASTASPPSAK